MPKQEMPKIDGMCVTKDKFHYHTRVYDEKGKEWYLNGFWAVSVGHCHESGKQGTQGNPYIDWNVDD